MRKFASKFAVVSLSFALAVAFAGCSGKPQLFEENAHSSLEIKPKTSVDATITNDADYPIYVTARAKPAPAPVTVVVPSVSQPVSPPAPSADPKNKSGI